MLSALPSALQAHHVEHLPKLAAKLIDLRLASPPRGHHTGALGPSTPPDVLVHRRAAVQPPAVLRESQAWRVRSAGD